MPLTKSHGNMYPWVTHTHSHLAGECPHKCKYCYVQAMAEKFPGMKKRYSGPIRLEEKEFDVKYGTGKTIFIEHCNDLFAYGVPNDFKKRILAHCWLYPENTYVFQTKNTGELFAWIPFLPPKRIIGTTIESDIDYPDMSKAPKVMNRAMGLSFIKGEKIFVTIEPVLDFNVDQLAALVGGVRPFFVNLGADSKNRGLPEPSVEKIMELVEKLKKSYGIELREKHNLQRLRKE